MQPELIYDHEAIRAELRPAFREAGHGSRTALATELGVTPQAVSGWARGRTCPHPKHWPAIETYLGLAPGQLAAVSSAREVSLFATTNAVAALRQRVEELEGLVAKLTALVEQTTQGRAEN